MFGVSKQTSSTKQIKGSQNAISCHVNSPTPPLPPPNQPQQESMIDLVIRLHYRHFIVCKNVGVYNSHIVISLGKIAARIARYRLACGAGFRFRLTSMTRSISWCSFFPRLSASGTLPLFCCLKKKKVPLTDNGSRNPRLANDFQTEEGWNVNTRMSRSMHARTHAHTHTSNHILVFLLKAIRIQSSPYGTTVT